MTDQQAVIIQPQPREHISVAIKVWLLSKHDESGSKRTEAIYRDHLTSFRSGLLSAGYDLDGIPLLREASDIDREQALAILALSAQGWASQAQRKEHIGASTYNQRLSAISSFYLFAKKRQLLRMDNPIDLLDRRKVQEYAQAQPLMKEEVIRALTQIDRTILAGKRDYALLLAFISTGRRASEVLALQWKHVRITGNTVTLHFHCKGGIEMYDTLEPRVSKALLEYLHTLFIHDLARLDGEQYLWLSLSMKRFKKPLTQRGLADIAQKRLNTMKVHTTRHTFAHSMEKSGAKVTDIQARLGHSNVATTGRYLQRLNSAENKHVSQLLDYLGVEADEDI
jgi:integrase